MRPMRPILGGNVPPSRVVGRDNFIRKMWRGLENQSVVLVAERRIGKTTVIRKMAEEPEEGWFPVFMLVEGVRSPTEFISRIVDQLSPILSKRERGWVSAQKLYDHLGGQKIGTWELPELKQNWKRILASMLEDIRESFEDRVVFFWDELPLMISNIKADQDATAAMELLDVLRDLRVEDDSGKLRMVFTGSIGLHLVVSELLHRGYRNDPTNDMITFSLEGLATEDALELARQGLEALASDGDLELDAPVSDLAAAIAEATDGLPYYVNYCVDRLTEIQGPIEVRHVPEAVDALILDPEDTAHFEHYAERIEAYYLFDETAEELAFAILKILSHATEPMPEAAIRDAVAAKVAVTSENLFQKALKLLVKDHYPTRFVSDGDRSYRFKYGIVQRWWHKNRG